MEKIFENAIEQNSLTEDEFKRIMHESFDAIFHYLGKANFDRWIDKTSLAGHIKKMVIEEFTEEDKLKYPYWNGYYTPNKDYV